MKKTKSIKRGFQLPKNLLGAALTLSLFSWRSSAQAGVILIPAFGPVTVPIEALTGSLVQFPSSVQTVSASAHFEIRDVGAEQDPVSGAKSNVKIFAIKALSGATAESVAFVLGNGTTVDAELVPAAGADRSTELVFPPQQNNLGKKQSPDDGFLLAEMDLMRALIRGDAGVTAPEVKSTQFRLSGGSETLGAKLLRVYSRDHLLGLVFEVTNKGDSDLALPMEKLRVQGTGPSGQAVLFHTSRLTLEACPSPFFGKNQRCKSLLFVVSRLGLAPHSALVWGEKKPRSPFVKAPLTSESRKSPRPQVELGGQQ